MTGNERPAIEVEKNNWSIRRRQEFIEFRLLWEGRVNRSGLRNEFSISEQQASLDIGRYNEAAPGNMEYDPNQKAYVRTESFKPQFVEGLTDRYLLQLHAVVTGRVAQRETWFDKLPVGKVAALPQRPKNWRTVMSVIEAIRSKREISVVYDSLTATSDAHKNLAPHALGYGAGRWHMRAWSREHNDFRDYTLDRIGKINRSKPADVDPLCDRAWHTEFEMIIAPNDQLAPEHQQAIAAERGMVDNELKCSLPISMCFYLEGELNLDLVSKVKFGDGTKGTVKPARLPLVLKNLDDYEAAKRMAKRDTIDALAEHWKAKAS